MRALTPSAGGTDAGPAPANTTPAVESSLGLGNCHGGGLGQGGEAPSLMGQGPGQNAVMPQIGAVSSHTAVAGQGARGGMDFGMMSSHAPKDPSVMNAIEGGASKDQVLGEANRVMDKAKVDPAWGQKHQHEVTTADSVLKQHQAEVQKMDPERGLRQQMTHGGPDRSPGREPGRDLAADGPKQDALKQPEPAQAGPEKGGAEAGTQGALDKVKTFVTEHPVATAAIAMAAVYALQSAFSSGGGSIMGAGKWGLLAGGAAMIGGMMTKKDGPEDNSLGIGDALHPINAITKLGKMAMAKWGPSGSGKESSAASGTGGAVTAQASEAAAAAIKPSAGPSTTKTI